MKITGICSGVLTNIETGEVTKTFEYENHIQDYFLEYNNAASTARDFELHLFVSSTNPGKQSSSWATSSIGNARGSTTIPGVEPQTDVYEALPNVNMRQIARRFNPPAQDTEINMVGVCNGVTNPQATVTNPSAVVWLASTLVQTPVETLDIYYRIQVVKSDNTQLTLSSNTGCKLSPLEERFYANTLIDAYVARPFYNSQQWMSLSGNNVRPSFSPLKLNYRNYDVYPTASMYCTGDENMSEAYSNFYFRRDGSLSLIPAENTGKALTWMGPTSYSSLFIQRVKSIDGSPVQGIFGHSSGSTGPFYSPTASQLGLGTIGVNGDNWTDGPYPEFYEINIETSGLAGVSTYKFKRQKTLGFSGNSFGWQGVHLPFTSEPNKHLTDGFAICRDNYLDFPMVLGNQDITNDGSYPTTYDAAAMAVAFEYESLSNTVMFLWIDSFCITDITTGETTAFDSTKVFSGDITPKFVPTDIRQRCVTSGNEIYIACGATGLYKFNSAPHDTLTVIDANIPSLSGTQGCYGVCEGYNGRIWAFFGHTTTPDIYYSDDSGATWTGSGYNEASLLAAPELVVGLQADRNNVDGHLAVIHITNLFNAVDIYVKFSWWNHSTSTSTYVATIRRDRYNYGTYTHWKYYIPHHYYYYGDAITCSPNQSHWNCISPGNYDGRPTKYVFEGGSSSGVPTTAPNYYLHTNYVVDKDGDDAIFYVANDTHNGGDPSGSGADSCSVMLKADHSYIEICPMTSGTGADVMLNVGDGMALYRSYNSTYRSGGATAIRGTSQNSWKIISVAPTHVFGRDYSAYPNICHLTLPEYGWDGANWVKGHPDGKPTHADHQELIDGVTINFDDKGGTAPLLDSDHYTFTLLDGVFMDGSTSFDMEWSRYLKEVDLVTDTESATLPATTKVSNVLKQFKSSTDADYVDLLNLNTDSLVGFIRGTGTGLADVYSGRARSALPSIYGSAVSSLPNNTVLGEFKNVQGAVEATPYVYDYNSSQHIQAYFGLSNASVLGTPLDVDTIQYAIHMDSYQGGAGTPYRMKVRVVESGIERASVDDIICGDTDESSVRIILLNTGKMVYQYKSIELPEWTTLYESPAQGLVPLVDYHIDVAMVPQSNWGFELVTAYALDENNTDYYTYIGNGVDNGIFDPLYRVTDPKYTKVFIDGVEAVNIGTNNTSTVLAAGNIALFNTGGVIRYSADDVGKTIDVEAYVLKDQY